MRVSVHLLSQARPVQYQVVDNAYTKDGLYCVLLANAWVHKYPMTNIFRVEESYE